MCAGGKTSSQQNAGVENCHVTLVKIGAGIHAIEPDMDSGFRRNDGERTINGAMNESPGI